MLACRGTCIILRLIVNIILMRSHLSIWPIGLVAVLGMATPALGARPSQVFDGRQMVHFERTDPGRLRWNGFELGLDDHALLWFRTDPRGADLRRLGIADLHWVSKTLHIARVRGLPGEDGLDVALRMQAEIGTLLRGAMPDLLIPRKLSSIGVPPNDPRYSAQWYFERIDLESGWALETGSEDVTIVVVDNGCDTGHPDLKAKLDPGRDVVDDDDDPQFEPNVPGNEHGTACAGLAAAATDNGTGIAGACPECRVRCVRMLTSEPSGTPLSRDVAAFEFALSVDADIVSNSWGFEQPIPVPSPLRAVIERLIAEGRGGAGTVVVFAAGNDNREIAPDELQAIPGVITVGATNNFNEATPFSNRGRAVDVVAPTGTLAPDVSGPDGQSDDDYTAFFGGTSSACPIVAGIAGLLLSAAPQLTADEVENVLQQSAEPSFFATPGDDGHDTLYGYGIVRPEAALRTVLGQSSGGAPDAGVPDLPSDGIPGKEDPFSDAGSDPAHSRAPAPSSAASSDGEGCRSGARTMGPAGWLLFGAGLLERTRRARSARRRRARSDGFESRKKENRR